MPGQPKSRWAAEATLNEKYIGRSAMFHVYGGWIFCVIFYTFSTHRRSQHPPWTATPNKGFTPQSQRAKKKLHMCSGFNLSRDPGL